MTTRRAVLARAGAFGAAAVGAWWLREHVLFPAVAPRFAPGADGSGWLSFLGPDLAAVPASAGGQPVGALIDSGAQTSVLDRAAADRLGVVAGAPIPMLAYGLTGAPQVGRSGTAEVALGALLLPRLRLALLDLGPIVQATGGRVELVLGQDVLHHLAADFDFPNGRLALRAPDAPAPGALRPLAARLRGRELVTPVTAEGRALEAVVDTGSSAALSLSERAARSVGLLAPGRAATAQSGVTFGGASTYRSITARSLAWAGEPPMRDVPVQVFPTPVASLLAPDALLGVGALQARRLLIRMATGSMAAVGPAAAALTP